MMARIQEFMLIILFCCVLQIIAINYSEPLSPTTFQKEAKQGFSTNYFKTLKFDKYNKQNLDDVKKRGFTNLRLRCRADLKDLDMDVFLKNLETVVDDCLEKGIVPIISWIHFDAEAEGTEAQKEAYLKWWKDVAEKLKDKDYRLAFNLFTELGTDDCGDDCSESLVESPDKYNDWTKKVVKKIRDTGGNNKKRIIILGSPLKTAEGLTDKLPKKSIYENDSYMLLEWHIYASGPNKKYLGKNQPSQKFWNDTGDWVGKKNVDKAIKFANDFTSKYGLKTYLGAWMPQDNKKGQISQAEAINFGKYFVQKLKPIPWSMNVLDAYYDTKTSKWITGNQTIQGATLDMEKILNEIKSVM